MDEVYWYGELDNAIFQFFPSCSSHLDRRVAELLGFNEAFNSFPVAAPRGGRGRAGGSREAFNSFPVAADRLREVEGYLESALELSILSQLQQGEGVGACSTET